MISKISKQIVSVRDYLAVLSPPILGLVLIIFLSAANAQQKNESDSSQRMAKSMTQLTAALSIKRGLSEDSKCSGKRYRSLSLENYINWIDKVGQNKNEKKMTTEKKDELKEMFDKMIDITVPNQGPMWRMTYEIMKKNWINTSAVIGGELCDSLNESAEGLYQKAIDNIRLIE